MHTVVAAASLLGVLCASGGLAAAEPSNPIQVIEQLESQGYTVHVDRIGSAPLEECTVIGIRNPQAVVQPNVVIERDRHGDLVIGFEEVLLRLPISVSLDCTV